MKFLTGFISGAAVVLILGAVSAMESYSIVLSGAFENVGTYQSTFSGVSAEGDCYLAITNTITGKSEVLGITPQIRAKLTDKPFQLGREGSLIVELTMR